MSSDEAACDVQVHTNMKRYCVRDVVIGAIVLTFHRPITVTRVILKWKGSVQKKLSGFENDITVTEEGYKRETLDSKETILNFCIDMFAGASSSGSYSAGTLVLPFSFHLSDHYNLSGSYPLLGNPAEINIMRVVYKLKAEVYIDEFPMAKNFRVIDICQKLAGPIEKSQGMIDAAVPSWCFCFGGGRVKVVALLDKNAYCPGETIEAFLAVDATNSSTDFPKTAARLASYCKIGNEHFKKRNFGDIDGPTILKGTKSSFKLEIHIPENTNAETFVKSNNYKFGTEFQFFLNSEIVLNIPIVIYALQLENETLPLRLAKYLAETFKEDGSY